MRKGQMVKVWTGTPGKRGSHKEKAKILGRPKDKALADADYWELELADGSKRITHASNLEG